MTSKLPSTSNPPQLSITTRISAIIVLLRPHQYYKNVLVFFGIFFSGNLFQANLWLSNFLAFVALCLVSSLNYLINDFRDREKDLHHPEKCTRPFPSGKVSSRQGIMIIIFLSLILILILAVLPISINNGLVKVAVITEESKIAFILILGALFITSQIYSLLLKNIVFADIVTISVNYVWRAIAGAVLITVNVSPWLIILCFITAMMLSLAKRKGDLAILGDLAYQHKVVFKMYTSELIDQSLSTVVAIELLAVFIYLVEKHPNETVFILLSLPLFTFTIFRYLFLVSRNNIAGRRAEQLFFDKQLIFTGLIILLLFFIVLYFPMNFLDNLLGIPDPTQ
ncbi:MAG: UbiA prenyltransferase family protein [Candidatus Hodarchaeales archaeon]